MFTHKNHLFARSELEVPDAIRDAHIVMCLEVLGEVKLVLFNLRTSPASTFVRIKHPASPIILPSVLLSGDIAVYLDHRIEDVLDVLSFWN